MFNWDGCPPGLFDSYIEVGDIKKSKFQTEDCVFIEIWVTAHFARNYIREECKHPMRTPIYGVLKQIKEMCGSKPVCIIIMCDDMGVDTIDWGVAIYLMLKQLEKENIIKHSMLFTKNDEKTVLNFAAIMKHCSNQDKETFLLLFNMLDAIVYQQPNYYAKQQNMLIKTRAGGLPPLLNDYIKATQKNM